MSIVLLILAGLLAIPVLVFSLEVLFSLLPRKKLTISDKKTPPFVVLIPAHNESGTIEKTLINIKEQLSEQDSMLVVADNCTDNTAEMARTYGAEVIERSHDSDRGKGFALDFGIKHLQSTKPEIVIIIDADCLVEEGALQKLAITANEKTRPIQALYLMKYTAPSLKQRISEFAWLVKNHVRPLGLSNLGLPCQLMGTGMAFPWSIISTASLATSNIVEDMKMGLDMAIEGHAPIFLPDAAVNSFFPEVMAAEKSQKKRWEHGHLNLMVTVLPKMFWLSLIKMSKDLFAMAFDLLVPPLSLLVLINLVFLMTLLFLSFAYPVNVTLQISSVTFLTLLTASFIAWFKWGKSTVSFTDLLSIPFYIIGKIPLYISAIFKRQKEWIRTDRDE